MTLEGGGRQEKDFFPGIFTQVNLVCELEGSRERNEEAVEGEERLTLGLYVCGIYMLTLIVFHCADASPFLSSPFPLSQVSAAVLVRAPNWFDLHLLRAHSLCSGGWGLGWERGWCWRW